MIKNMSIDINADVGEGIGNESHLLPLISSCNIACGGHAGDKSTMREVVKLAITNGVKIGAHPSFPDKKNFGRQVMQMSYSALYTSINDQIQTLQDIAWEEQVLLHHVKPHGALYNLAASDKKYAKVIVEVMKRFHQPLKLYVPYGSVIADIAINEGVLITYEAFADRNYNQDLSLVSREESNAIISDTEEMYNHVLNMIINHKVKTLDGVEVYIKASTFCLHGDNPEAIKLVSELYKKLTLLGIQIQ
jgi:UPF0271 protein